MILAYHSIFSAYGFWLPNDPRGSWSDCVRSWELFRFGGPATKTEARHSLAAEPHDQARREQVKAALNFPPVRFTGPQAQSVGNGFARAVCEAHYRVLACCILPEHVHTVIARHERRIERIVGHLKARATQQLRSGGRHPLAGHATPDGLCLPPGHVGPGTFTLMPPGTLPARSSTSRRIPRGRANPRSAGPS